MATAFFTHSACLQHDNGQGHPENPERLRAILRELEKPDYKNLLRFDAPRGEIEHIIPVHDHHYVEKILALVPKHGHAELDQETSLSPQSGEAALRGVGAVIAAVDAVMEKKATNAFCAVRPPGHHAQHAPSSGFCLFNNIAVGASHAMNKYRLKRVAIVDFDVHHGNGTQGWAEKQDGVLFFSSHQFPLWPGSGLPNEVGSKHNLVNIPLPPATIGDDFRTAINEKVFPRLEKFQPELILISAGFDAHRDDPLGGLRLDEDDFHWITAELVKASSRLCQGRIVSTLEGGYDPDALAASTGAHLKALMAA